MNPAMCCADGAESTAVTGAGWLGLMRWLAGCGEAEARREAGVTEVVSQQSHSMHLQIPATA